MPSVGVCVTAGRHVNITVSAGGHYRQSTSTATADAMQIYLYSHAESERKTCLGACLERTVLAGCFIRLCWTECELSAVSEVS